MAKPLIVFRFVLKRIPPSGKCLKPTSVESTNLQNANRNHVVASVSLASHIWPFYYRQIHYNFCAIKKRADAR